MTRIFARILYVILELLARVLYWIPLSFKTLVVKVAARIWFYVLPFRKKVILHNLIAVFPKERTETSQQYQKRILKICLANLEHMVWILEETLERPAWDEKWFRRAVTLQGAEHPMKLFQHNQGFFFISGHIGNWELLTRVGRFMGLRLAIITRFLRNPFFDELWVQSRLRYGLELLEESGSGLATLRSIRKGFAVGFVLDQHTGKPHGLESKFLGLRAWCPKGLAVMTMKSRIPVIPVRMIRDRPGHQRVVFEPVLTNLPFRAESGKLTDDELEAHIRFCNGIMEQWIRERPEQYLWMHKRFKNILDYRQPVRWPD